MHDALRFVNIRTYVTDFKLGNSETCSIEKLANYYAGTLHGGCY